MMQFKTYKDLNHDIIDNLYKIPNEIDLIVGVPRSGMMVALIIGLYLNLPVTCVDDFLTGQITSSGTTKPKDGWIHDLDEARHILVVEDSVNSGASLNRVRESIGKSSPYANKCSYMAVYVTPENTSVPDFYFKKVNGIRIFQWNFLTHGFLQDTCMDMDGVLCYDPTDEENDDGEKYIRFLNETRLKLKPQRTVGYIVTSRLEKYRQETETWLKNNNIEYEELYMMDVATAEERRRLGNHATNKAEIYKKLSHATLFIESDDTQAREIFRITKKPVFCIDSQEYYSNENREAFHEQVMMSKNRIRHALSRIKLLQYVYRKIHDSWGGVKNNCTPTTNSLFLAYAHRYTHIKCYLSEMEVVA